MTSSKQVTLPATIPLIAIFIDAGNLWSVYKKIGKLLDFSKLNLFFEKKFNGHIFRTSYYVAYPTEGCISMGLRTGSNGYFDIRDFEELHGVKLFKKENK